jgi:hypothetical protein
MSYFKEIANYLWLYSPCGSWCLFQFLNLYVLGRTLWAGDQPAAGRPPTHRTTETQNKRTETSMPRVGFGTTILVFERAKMILFLDRAATVTGNEKTVVTIIFKQGVIFF